MIDWIKRTASAEIRLILFVCLLVSVLDFTMRVLPDSPAKNDLGATEKANFFVRLVPSEAWIAWYEGIKIAIEDEARQVAEARRVAEAEAKAKAEAKNNQAPKNDTQSGDMLRVNIGEITYELWGVFSKADKLSDDDTFGVLKSRKGTVQVRTGDLIGSYRVTGIDARSVVFASTVDERVVTLWLFGKGPR